MNVWGEWEVVGGHVGIYILFFLLPLLPAWNTGGISITSYLEAKQLSCDARGKQECAEDGW